MQSIEGKSRKRKAPSSRQSKSREKAPIIPYGICTQVSKRYEKVGRLGHGTYGVVYKAIDRESKNKNFVALKRCIPHHEARDGFPVTTLREIHALRLCSKHPNIVDLLTVAVSNSSGVFLVMPFEGDLDIADILDEDLFGTTPFGENHIKTLLQQLLSALKFMHGHCLVHRDIKASNLLYSEKGELKLADFGLSRHIYDGQRNLTANVVSLWYRAPELLSQENIKMYGFGIDNWAVGCIFAELLQGKPLLPGKDVEDQVSRMVSCLGRHSLFDSFGHIKQDTKVDDLLDTFSNLSTEGLTLLTNLLRYDPKERWTAEKALDSDYFTVEPLPATIMPKFNRHNRH